MTPLQNLAAWLVLVAGMSGFLALVWYVTDQIAAAFEDLEADDRFTPPLTSEIDSNMAQEVASLKILAARARTPLYVIRGNR